MSIYNSLYAGMSGLNSNSNNIGIIGDNIANINTPGFKASRGQFEDIFAQSLVGAGSATGSQVGIGSRLMGVVPILTQGGLQTTGSATDLAINGNGLFVLNPDDGGVSYTRSGQFLIDKDGYMINPNGLRLQGYQADSEGNITGELSDIRTIAGSSMPSSTTEAEFALNLKSDDEIIAGGFDIDNAHDSSNFSTGITAYDSQGNPRTLNLFFCKVADNQWDVHVLVNSNELDPPGPGEYTDLTEGLANRSLTFNENGTLAAEPDFSTTALDIPWSGGVEAGSITLDFGTPGTADGVTQHSRDSHVVSQSQDGHAAGDLMNFSINQEGILFGTFENGNTRALAQVALARFPNEAALSRNGGNLYAETPGSGEAILGTAASPDLGKINSNYLELSNVDLAAEFVNLILSQRAYQANSRVVTNANTLLTELVNLIR